MNYKRLGERIREERRKLGLRRPSSRRPLTSRIPTWVPLSAGNGDLRNIMSQFKPIVDNQPMERKQMAINVLRTIFAYFDKEGA